MNVKLAARAWEHYTLQGKDGSEDIQQNQQTHRECSAHAVRWYRQTGGSARQPLWLLVASD